MAKKAQKESYYAVKAGRQPGIYSTWADAELQVKGFRDARYKKFTSMREAQAFMNGSDGFATTSNTPLSSHADASMKSHEPSRKRSSSDVDGTVDSSRPSKRPSLQGLSLSAKEKELVDQGYMVVFCDGACSKNGSKQARAGSGVHWVNPSTLPDISERTPGKQTNQCAELYAMVRVFQMDPDPAAPLCILSDSRYSIDCMTKWLPGWARRGWLNVQGQPVVNSELIRLLHAYQQRRSGKVTYKWVAAHAGIPGNERADELAVAGAQRPEVPEVDWKQELVRLSRTTHPATTATLSGGGTALRKSKAGKDGTHAAPVTDGRSPGGPAVDDEIQEEWFLDKEEEAALAALQKF